jgi:hypothetical protein
MCIELGGWDGFLTLSDHSKGIWTFEDDRRTATMVLRRSVSEARSQLRINRQLECSSNRHALA